jgi:hypothetical protein
LPFTVPYLAGRTAEDFKYGANFAVGGATALNNDYFRKRDVDPNWTEHSLDEQIRWFKQLLRLLPSQQGTQPQIRTILYTQNPELLSCTPIPINPIVVLS